MQQTAAIPSSRRSFSILAWLRGYDRTWLRLDLIAALTTWALIVPQSIAYGQIAGLPPQAGMFTSFAALLGYALLGTSRQLIVSPASAPAAVSASLVAPLALGDADRFWTLSSGLALMVGVMFVVYGLLKLGFVSQFIAASVQAGLMFGLGLTIIAGQLPKILGTPSVEGPFLEEVAGIVRTLDGVNWWTVALGVVSLAALLVGKRVAPQFPTALAVVVVSILIVTVLGMVDHGVAVLGNVGTQVPLPKIPVITIQDIAALLPGVIALSLIGYAESDTVAEEFATKHRYDIKPNQELIAIGVGNAASGLFRGFIVAGGASQSATNERAGAKTQLSGLIVSGLVFLTAVLLMPLFTNLAQAVLGAIVISAVLGFINVPALRRIYTLRRESFWLSMLALFGVLILGVLPGLLLAVFISAALVLVRLSQPKATELGQLPERREYISLERNPEAKPIPGLLIMRLDAPLFAFNAQSARNLIREHTHTASARPRVVLFDLEMTSELDIGSVDKLAILHHELQADGVQLWLARVHDAAADMLRRSGLADEIGKDHIFPSIDAGVAGFMALPEAASQVELEAPAIQPSVEPADETVADG
jgi:high affinity sulfate transporter 1